MVLVRKMAKDDQRGCDVSVIVRNEVNRFWKENPLKCLKAISPITWVARPTTHARQVSRLKHPSLLAALAEEMFSEKALYSGHNATSDSSPDRFNPGLKHLNRVKDERVRSSSRLVALRVI